MSEAIRTPTVELRDRANGALLGLAIGDALGLPADFHRSIRTPWPRQSLWRVSAELDAQQVSRPLLPFAPDLSGIAGVVATDDTETALVAALVLQRAAGLDPTSLAREWLAIMGAPDVWGSVSTRSAVINLTAGLQPPLSGKDNPSHYDDTAVPAAVSIAIAFSSDPERAELLARDYASITNAEDGVDAAVLMAGLVARLIDGMGLEAAVSAIATPGSEWLAGNLRTADRLVDGFRAEPPASPFAVLPELIELLSPRNHSHAGVAPETVPLALAIARLCDADAAIAIPLALSVARKADSLPAFVGSLCGAAHGAASIPGGWAQRVDAVPGILVPSLAGTSLADTSDHLLALFSPGKESL